MARFSVPHTSFNKNNDRVVKSERDELVRGSDPPLKYSARTTAGDVWRAPIRLLLDLYLAAGVWKTETRTLDRLATGIKDNFERM